MLNFDLDYLPRLPRDKSPASAASAAGSSWPIATWWRIARRASIRWRSRRGRRRSAQAVAERHGIATVYDTYQEMLAERQVEVVDIAVPPDVQIDVIERGRASTRSTSAASWRRSRWA